MLRKACDFFHRLLVSIGTPESVPEGVGFTMKTLCEFQIRYVDMATSLPPQEKNEWLNYGYETFVEHALGKIEELMLARLGSSRPSSPPTTTVHTLTAHHSSRRRACPARR